MVDKINASDAIALPAAVQQAAARVKAATTKKRRRLKPGSCVCNQYCAIARKELAASPTAWLWIAPDLKGQR